MGAASAALAVHNGDHHGPEAGVSTAPYQPARQSVGKRKHETAVKYPCDPPMKKKIPLYSDNINTRQAVDYLDFAQEEEDFYAASYAGVTHSTNMDSGLDGEFGHFDFDINALDVDGLAGLDGGTTRLAEQPSFDEDYLSQFIRLHPVPEPTQPPSSIVHENCTVSNPGSSAINGMKVNPTLQYSPPSSVSPPVEERPDHEGSILIDTSWDNLESFLDEFSADKACNSKNEYICEGESSKTRTLAQQTTPPSTARSVPPGLMLRPYKTWFHIREMLEAKETMYRNQDHAKFELFARVVYTCRENFERKQLFQLRDLFKISPPYLPGVLLN